MQEHLTVVQAETLHHEFTWAVRRKDLSLQPIVNDFTLSLQRSSIHVTYVSYIVNADKVLDECVWFYRM